MWGGTSRGGRPKLTCIEGESRKKKGCALTKENDQSRGKVFRGKKKPFGGRGS